jgi:hypothetical protein
MVAVEFCTVLIVIKEELKLGSKKTGEKTSGTLTVAWMTAPWRDQRVMMEKRSRETIRVG